MRELFQNPAFWPALIFACLLAANLWVFLTREWESNHRAVDYARINHPLDAPSIRRWQLQDNLLEPEIIWNRTPSHWQHFVDGKMTATLPGNAPAIELCAPKFHGKPGELLADFRHTHVLRPLPEGIGPDLIFSLVHIAREHYRDKGMHFPDDIVIFDTKVIVGKFRRRPVSDWIDDYAYMGQSALAEADRIVRDEIGVQDADDTLLRMEKITAWMRHQLINAGGVPKDDFRWLDPLSIFKEMRDGNGKGWCTQNAQIFTFFANRAGVPTRFVFCGTVQSNRLIYNGHSWVECYLKEQHRWAYADPQQAIVAVHDHKGIVLNSADVFHLCERELFEGVTARTFKAWQWQNLPVEAPPGAAVTVPFSLVNQVARNQFNPQTIIKYRLPPNVEDTRDIYSMLLKSPTYTWVNFKRYLFEPAPAYSHLPTNGVLTYRVRQSLFAGLVAALTWLAWAAC
ncbi:MAG: transglutaminase-like domain-containing protein [Cephaloticoccus sp.]|nr:transglutaminase-like domain-containing protein [Cephaloticoccus sp.]MCF7760527.1 transglutaminase-like domain-containing protein [Cephaloticoccus sp.]